MNVAVIINPTSGRHGRRPGSGRDRVETARAHLARTGLAGDVAVTEGPAHAVTLARSFVERGVPRVIAWGGDGTINEVAGALVGTSVVLGVVPAGSGDGLACSLGLPLRTNSALETAVSAEAGPLDVGFLGDRHFLNVAGVGFDAAVAQVFNERRARGGLGYLTGSLARVWSYRCARYRLELDEHIWSGDCFVAAFANGREYGNHVVIAPGADPQDGLLDAVVVSGGSAVTQFWRSRRLWFRREHPASGVYRTRVRRASISGDSLTCHVDGETFEASGTLAIRVQPSAIRVAGVLRKADVAAGL